MAISFVSSASATADTVAMPAHQAGDLILVFAYHNNSNIAPLSPAEFVEIASAGTNTNGSRLAYKWAVTNSETIDTWTGATEIIVHVYRGVMRIGADSVTSGGSGPPPVGGSSVVYPALALKKTGGTSWVVRFAGNRTNITGGAPSGYVERQTQTRVKGLDTDGSVSADQEHAAQAAAHIGWHAHSVELRGVDEPVPAKLHTFVDDFDGASLDIDKWQTVWPQGGVPFVADGRLVLDTNAGLTGVESAGEYDLVNSHALADIDLVPSLDNRGFAFSLGINTNGYEADMVTFWCSYSEEEERFGLLAMSGAGFMSLFDPEGEYDTPIEAVVVYEPYDPIAHRWLRLRESSGTVYWEASPDGLSWTVFASAAHTFTHAYTTVVMDGFLNWASYSVDNLNLPPQPTFIARVHQDEQWAEARLKTYDGTEWIEQSKAWSGDGWRDIRVEVLPPVPPEIIGTTAGNGSAVTLPLGVAEGDLILISIGSTVSVTASGYTQTAAGWAIYRIATGSEATVTLSQSRAWVAVVVRNVDTDAGNWHQDILPYDGVFEVHAPSIAQSGSLLICIVSAGAAIGGMGPIGGPSGMTLLAATPAASNGVTVAILIDPPNPTGMHTFTVPGDFVNNIRALSLLLPHA